MRALTRFRNPPLPSFAQNGPIRLILTVNKESCTSGSRGMTPIVPTHENKPELSLLVSFFPPDLFPPIPALPDEELCHVTS